MQTETGVTMGITMARRGRPKRNTMPVVDDYGPAERWQHAERIIGAADIAIGGTTQARLKYPTILHKLRDMGVLGRGKPLEARFSAGQWLRDLHDRTRAQRLVGGAERVSQGIREMTDADAWNYRCWQDTIRDMGPAKFGILERTCCEDRWPEDHEELCWALDALAKHRGMG